MDILDVPKIYRRYQRDWNIWTNPLVKDGWWYSKDYYKETIEAFENASGGMKIIFLAIEPLPNKPF